MRCFLFGVAGFIITAIVTALAFSSYGDYLARARLMSAMAAIEPLRKEIADIITRQHADGSKDIPPDCR